MKRKKKTENSPLTFATDNTHGRIDQIAYVIHKPNFETHEPRNLHSRNYLQQHFLVSLSVRWSVVSQFVMTHIHVNRAKKVHRLLELNNWTDDNDDENDQVFLENDLCGFRKSRVKIIKIERSGSM